MTLYVPPNRFDIYIDRILGHEGGYVNDPRDSGGETKWGISKRSYPNLDIRNLTREEAIEIYRRDFWNPVNRIPLPSDLAYQALDAAVNHGIGNAIRWIQRAAGVADDGSYGPVTAAAVTRTSAADLILRFNAERLVFYTNLSNWSSFGKGWVRRVAANLKSAAEDNDG